MNVLVYLCIFVISMCLKKEYSRFKKNTWFFLASTFRSWIIIFIQSNKNPPHPNPKKWSKKKCSPNEWSKKCINRLATFTPFPHLGRKLFERSFTLQRQDTDGVVNTWSQLERTGGGQFLSGMHRLQKAVFQGISMGDFDRNLRSLMSLHKSLFWDQGGYWSLNTGLIS